MADQRRRTSATLGDDRRQLRQANSAGLKALASQLLTLAQDGAHLRLEENNGPEGGSVGLVLERCDDERLVPDTCQVGQGTTGNSGEPFDRPPRACVASPQVKPVASPRRP